MDPVTALTEAVLQRLDGRTAPLLVAIDGRAGSGKSTTARGVAERLAAHGVTTTVIGMDELYDGWHGLAAGPALLFRRVLTPLRDGTTASYPRFDWYQGRYDDEVLVPATSVVLVEGVGSSAVPVPLLDLRVWLELPTDLRRERALRRDGEMFAPHWESWAAQESELLAEHPVSDRTHLVLTTTDH